MLCLSLGAWSQTKTITGLVLNETKGEPLIGASILLSGTNNGVITDVDGRFSMELSDQYGVIECSYLGFKQMSISVDGRDFYEFRLQSNDNLLDEIVVTALNLERSRKDLGYAIQELNAREISEVKSVNFVDNLGGRVAGLVVNQGATGVGSTTKVTIRGESSFSNNNPLFVVDGLPIQNNTNLNFSNEAAAGFQEIDFGNGAMDINQDDIESVSVLKGPAAAALYGTRAANGVILITTKKGKDKDEISVNFNSSLFIDQPFKLPEFQNRYGQGNSGEFAFVNGLGAGVNDNITYSWGPELDVGNMIPQFDSPVTLSNGEIVRGGDVAVHNGGEINPTAFVSHPDNLKDFYNAGFTSVNNLSFSKGIELGKVRFSFTDLRSDSYIPGVNLNKQTVAGRFSTEPFEGLNISANVNYVKSGSENRPSSGYGSENINYSLVAWGPRSLDTKVLQNYWQPGFENQQQYSFNYTFFDNPYFILLENQNGFNRNRFFGNLIASYQISEHLDIQASAGNDFLGENRSYKRHFSTNRFKTGAYAEQRIRFRERNLNFLLSYKNQIGKINSTLSFGGNRMSQNGWSQQKEATGLVEPGVFDLSNNASPLNDFFVESRKQINSLYALAQFSYDDFLFVDFTGRNDWSSALATKGSTDNTSFFYPSVSLSYIMSQHLEIAEVFSFFKVRASWAQVGNDTDPFQTEGTFVLGTPVNGDTTYTNLGVVANTDLRPEKTTAIEIGADIRFFDDRLRFDVSYYDALTEDQITSFAIPQSSGYSQQVVNGGAVRTKGLEILAGIDLIRNSNFNWTSTINFSRSNSFVEELPDGAESITLAYSRVYDNQNQTVWFQVEEGGRIGDMYGTGYLKNSEGGFIVTEEGNFIANNSLQKLGNYNPDFILGLSNDLSYKNWSLGFLFDWRQGGILLSRTLSLAAVGGQLIETENRPEEGIIVDGIVNVGTNSEPVWETNTVPISAESYYRQFYDRNHEVNNVYDASYIKLRQLSLGYEFRSTSNVGLLKDGRSLRVSLIGRNLFAWSEIPHFDPEQLAVQGNQFVNGVEDMSYPSARSIGVKIGFSL